MLIYFFKLADLKKSQNSRWLRATKHHSETDWATETQASGPPEGSAGSLVTENHQHFLAVFTDTVWFRICFCCWELTSVGLERASLSSIHPKTALSIKGAGRAQQPLASRLAQALPTLSHDKSSQHARCPTCAPPHGSPPSPAVLEQGHLETRGRAGDASSGVNSKADPGSRRCPVWTTGSQRERRPYIKHRH